MSGRPLIMVSFRLDVEQEAPFSEFYNHRYIPDLIRGVPGIEAAWRYQEHHVAGSLKYYRKQFLTLFACGSRQDADRVLAAIEARSEPELQEWRARHARCRAALPIRRALGPSAKADGR